MKLASFLLSLVALISLTNLAAAQVNVSFRNNSNAPAQVVWLNGNNEQVYATVQPGQTYTQSTFAGHQWKFAGYLQGTFATAAHDGQVVELGQSQPAAIVPQFVPVVPQNVPQPQPQPQQLAPIVPIFAPRPQVQPQVAQTSASVSEGVVAYAKSMIGVRVGNGQCTELAINALRSVGAEVKMDYTWGQEVRADQVQPGDIVQLPNPHTMVIIGVKGTEIEVLHQNVNGSPVQSGTFDTNDTTWGTMKFYRPVKWGPATTATNVGGAQAQNRTIQISNWQEVVPQVRRNNGGSSRPW